MSTISPLRLAIMEDGRSQRAIAEDAGIHPVTLSRVVGGASSDDVTKQKIARALNRTEDHLFGHRVGRRAA